MRSRLSPQRAKPVLAAPIKDPAHDTALPACRLRRLYPLGRMVEVLLYNLARIHNLWPIFLTHVCDILGDARPAVRSAATDALGKAVGGALAHVTARYTAGPVAWPCCIGEARWMMLGSMRR